MPSTFAYWPTRGLANQIRILLHYVGEDFENKVYNSNEDPDSKENWVNAKYNLGLPLPNLPYYIDGDIKISQSMAIERYLARKYKLEATTEEGRIREDNLVFLAVDLQSNALKLCYNKDFETAKPGHLKWVKEILKQLSPLLGDSDYFLGDKINYADFHLYQAISINTLIDPTCLKEFPNLQTFLQRIENLPRVKEFLASPQFVKEALIGPGGSFGYVPYKPEK